MTTLREQPDRTREMLAASCVVERAKRVARDMELQAQHHGIAVETLFACDPRLLLYEAVARMGERG